MIEITSIENTNKNTNNEDNKKQKTPKNKTKPEKKDEQKEEPKETKTENQNINNLITTDEEKQLIKLRLKADGYIKEFPKRLEKFKSLKFDTMEKDNLIKIIEEMHFTICCKTNLGYFTKITYDALEGTENIISTLTPLNINGMTKILKEDKEADEDLKAFWMQYAGFSFLPPHLSFFLRASKAAYDANNINRTIDIEKRISNVNEISNINNKYQDL